jgi:hypothetical protein
MKKGTKVGLIVGGVALGLCCVGGTTIALVGVGGAASEIDKQIQHGDSDKLTAVKINKCYKDSLGWVAIDFTVVNSTDRVQSYWAQFEITDAAGVRLGETHGVLNNINAGATAKESAQSTVEPKGKFTCSVVRVD